MWPWRENVVLLCKNRTVFISIQRGSQESSSTPEHIHLVAIRDITLIHHPAPAHWRGLIRQHAGCVPLVLDRPGRVQHERYGFVITIPLWTGREWVSLRWRDYSDLVFDLDYGLGGEDTDCGSRGSAGVVLRGFTLDFFLGGKNVRDYSRITDIWDIFWTLFTNN